MPSPSIVAAFDAAQQRHAEAVAALVPLLIEMALTSVAGALPGAMVLETEGEVNEDWLFTLRIRRVTNEYDLRAIYTDIEEVEPQLL